jgi:hypothetical protein
VTIRRLLLGQAVPALALGGLLAVAVSGQAQALPPVCEDGEFVTDPGEGITVPSDLCVDPEGNPYTLAVVTPPLHGTFTPDGDGGGQYDPEAGYHGLDEFTYRAIDSNAEPSAAATVAILVDTAPACESSAARVESGKPLVIPEPPCSDPDGDDFDLLLDDPQHGTLTISPDGLTATYVSVAGYVGTDTILYQAEDAFGLVSLPRMLRITVTAPPASPPEVRLLLPPRPSAPADTKAPQLDLARPSGKLGAVMRRGLRVTLTSDEAVGAFVTVTVSRATARKLELARSPKRRVVVGRLSAAIHAGRTSLPVKLTRRARNALKDVNKVTLHVEVVARDAAGNSSRTAATVTLRR